jgi:hypothetical protein
MKSKVPFKDMALRVCSIHCLFLCVHGFSSVNATLSKTLEKVKAVIDKVMPRQETYIDEAEGKHEGPGSGSGARVHAAMYVLSITISELTG